MAVTQTLDNNTAILSPLKGFTVLVKKYAPATFRAGVTPSSTSGTILKASVSRVIQTSDASPGECYLAIADPNTTIHTDNESTIITVPVIGDEIIISVGDVENPTTMNVIFKGIVSDISRQVNESGALYSINCKDMKIRLADEVIKKSYNETYDIATKPNFSEKDRSTTPIDGERWTIEEIIEDILKSAENQAIDIHSKYTPLTFFDFSDIDFNGISELSDFVPGSLDFDNVSVLEAIYRTAQSAGSYRMVYDPRDDKIIFTRLSLSANNCGNKRTSNWAKQDKNDPNKNYYYDSSINVISDSTVKRTTDLATVYRMFSAHIEWYSGHYYIQKNKTSYDTDTPKENSIYYIPNRNWDGYQYYAHTRSLGKFISTEDASDEVYNIVGCPLYPQWNPLNGYGPYERKIQKTCSAPLEYHPTTEKYSLHNGAKVTDSAFVNTTYDGQIEYEGYTELDHAFPQDGHFDSLAGGNDLGVALGFTYEAWFPWRGPCKYCGGSGAVSSVPEEWRLNYEEWFGDSRNSDGTIKRLPLTAFDYDFKTEDGEQVPQNHPKPWLNTCPACRGVGMEPKFKIINILGNLLDVSPDKLKIKNNSLEVATQRTWDDMVKDLTYNYGPQVQVETGTAYIAADANKDSNMPDHSLATTKSNVSAGPQVDIFDTDERKVEHIFRTQVYKNEAHSIDMKRGNVVFKSRVGINCRKPVKSIFRTVKNNVDYNIKDSTNNNKTVYVRRGIVGGFDDKTLSYWRPAKAWISCFFRRDRYYEDYSTNNPKNPKNIYVGSGDGSVENYRVATKIWDGRAAFEVRNKNPDDVTEFDARPVVKGYTSDDFRWQVYPDDAYKLPIPLTSDEAWDATNGVYKANQNADYYYSQGVVEVIEPLRKDEADVIPDIDLNAVMRADVFGKPIQWILRDERFKLIEKAVKELEKRNDVQITGTLIVRGSNYDLGDGMGYIQFPDGRKACIVKIEHDLANGSYTTSLELSTEEIRLGQEKESELDYKRKLEHKISKLFLSPAYDRNGTFTERRKTKENYSDASNV